MNPPLNDPLCFALLFWNKRCIIALVNIIWKIMDPNLHRLCYYECREWGRKISLWYNHTIGDPEGQNYAIQSEKQCIWRGHQN